MEVRMLQVNFSSAEDIANKMGQASDSLGKASVQGIVKASKTTVTVNGESQDAHETLMNLSKDFHAALNKTIEQINTVAKEFDRTDTELNDNMNQLLQFNYLPQNGFMK